MCEYVICMWFEFYTIKKVIYRWFFSKQGQFCSFQFIPWNMWLFNYQNERSNVYNHKKKEAD